MRSSSWNATMCLSKQTYTNWVDRSRTPKWIDFDHPTQTHTPMHTSTQTHAKPRVRIQCACYNHLPHSLTPLAHPPFASLRSPIILLSLHSLPVHKHTHAPFSYERTNIIFLRISHRQALLTLTMVIFPSFAPFSYCLELAPSFSSIHSLNAPISSITIIILIPLFMLIMIILRSHCYFIS